MTPEPARHHRSTRPSSSAVRPCRRRRSTIEDTGLLVRSAEAADRQGAVRRRAERPGARPTSCACPICCSSRWSSICASRSCVEVRGAHGSGTAGYRYALTDLGRERAVIYFDGNGYVGPAPVPLKQYTAAMHEAEGAARLSRSRAHRPRLHAPDRQPRDAGPARSGRELRQVGVPLRPSWKRQDGGRGRHRHVRSAATSTCPGRSTSTARSSPSSTRSIT